MTQSNQTLIRPLIGIGVIVLKDNQILLGKRIGSHGEHTYAPPGGHLEFGESIQEGAYRELNEETSLEALNYKELGWVENIFSETKHYITFFTLIDSFKGLISLNEPTKCLGWEWYDIDNLPIPLFQPLLTFLEKRPLLR